MVLCTATAGNLRDVDFLPLTVDVEERMYAAGKIPGSFFKREGRAGEKGTLTARMIDRPIRPLFPKGWRYETQLVALPISVDHVNPYDILAMNGASAALMVSDIPFPTPVGAVRIGKVDGNFVVNPDEEDLLEGTDLDLIVAGTEEAILMVEAGANEIPEAEILDALDIAHERSRSSAPPSASWPRRPARRRSSSAPRRRRGPLRGDQGLARRRAGRRHPGRGQARAPGRDQGGRGARSSSALRRPGLGGYAEQRGARAARFDKLEKTIIRERIAVQKKRPDGRSAEEIRPISIEVGVAPRTHGSALFTRGQTQALASPRSAPRGRRCASTRSAWRRTSATSTTTTSRRSRSGRPASCAGPSAATSATGRSPSGPWCR